MPQIQYAPPMPGIPQGNAFTCLDDGGMECGRAVVVEYINHAILPKRPLNYYLSISAEMERGFDLLMGAALARTTILRRIHPTLPARIYTPCAPYDTTMLRAFESYGFQNDDAVMRMRKILKPGEGYPRTPMGCIIAPVAISNENEQSALLSRLNAYAVMAKSLSWLQRLQGEQPLCLALGVFNEGALLGEMLLTGYGAEGKIEMIYTRPDMRRRGIARALISHGERILLEGGLRSLVAEVWRRNEPAMDLFATEDFESITPTLLYPGMNV